MNHKGTMNMKLTLSVVIFTLSSTIASAGVFDDFKADLKNLIKTFPAHEQDGYRDTGCDKDYQVAIKNADGDILYWNNSTCPVVEGSAAPDLSSAVTPSTPDKPTPVDPKDCDKKPKSDKPKGKDKGKGKGK